MRAESDLFRTQMFWAFVCFLFLWAFSCCSVYLYFASISCRKTKNRFAIRYYSFVPGSPKLSFNHFSLSSDGVILFTFHYSLVAGNFGENVQVRIGFIFGRHCRKSSEWSATKTKTHAIGESLASWRESEENGESSETRYFFTKSPVCYAI